MGTDLFDAKGRPIIVLDNPTGTELYDASGRPYRVVDGGVVYGGEAVSSGSTFPVSPSVGQFFLHIVTGRKILYQWDGTVWQPVKSYGSMTIYVGKTGTDERNSATNGTAVGTPFLTVQYAIDTIPSVLGGSVLIIIGAGTFAEDVYIGNKSATWQYGLSGRYSITLLGTMTTLDTLTCGVGSVIGSDAAQGTVVRKIGTWTAHDRQNKRVKFTSGGNNGLISIIDDNTTSTLTLVGDCVSAPAQDDTFIVEDWGTSIRRIDLGTNQTGIVYQDLFISGDGTFFGINLNNSWVSVLGCSISGNAAAGWHLSKSWVYASYSIFNGSGYYTVDVNGSSMFKTQSPVSVTPCKFVNSNAGGIAVIVSESSHFGSANEDVYDCLSAGGNCIDVRDNATFVFVDFARVRGGNYNCKAILGGIIHGTVNVQYGAHGMADESADASSFID
jgi:hypothetical protein